MINKTYQKKKYQINPIYIEPRILYDDERFLPVNRYIYNGILPKYIVSNYGRIFDIVNNRFLNQYVYKGFARVEMNFYRYGKIVSKSIAVDWLVKTSFDYQGFGPFEGYTIKYLDRDTQNLYIENLRYIIIGKAGGQYTQTKTGEY